MQIDKGRIGREIEELMLTLFGVDPFALAESDPSSVTCGQTLLAFGRASRLLKNVFGVRRQAQRDAALDSQMLQNVKKSKAPPLSAHSKFHGLAIDKEFFSSLLGLSKA